MTNKGTVAEKLGEVQLARTRTVKGISNIEICLSYVELAISSEEKDGVFKRGSTD